MIETGMIQRQPKKVSGINKVAMHTGDCEIKEVKCLHKSLHGKMYVDVHISNITTCNIRIPPLTLLFELRTVTFANISNKLLNHDVASKALEVK